MKGGEVFRIFTIIFLIISMVTVAGSGEASSEPVISLNPGRVENMWPGETFTINITIADITEAESLHGWEFGLNVDPSILNVTSIDQGSFLQKVGPTWWVPYIDSETGNVGGTCFLLGYPPTGAYGSGVLASVTFRIKAYGYTPIHFYLTELRHYNGASLVPIDHASVDGFFTNLHNIAVTDVVPAPDAVPTGESVSIDVTVSNIGNFTETFNVTTYYGDNPIETQTDIILENGTSTTLTFIWNTTGVSIDTIHIISANATEVPQEIDTADNVYINGEVKVRNPLSPVARFIYSEPPIVNQPVTFDASNSTPALRADATIVSYMWNFGDNLDNITVLDPVTHHNYTAAGEYDVTLTVTNNYTLTDSTLKPITIEKQSSTISISASLIIVPVGGSTNITGSIDPKREGINVKIESNSTELRTNGGPLTVITDKNGQYSYLWEKPATGAYWVKTSWEGDENTFPATSNILTIKVLQPPTALFTITPSMNVIVNESVTFNAEASQTGKPRTIVSYGWDFGDGTPAVSENDSITTHIFKASGIYNVTLTVIDSEGLKDTETETITVLQPPTATFTYSPQPPPVSETITFDASESYDDGEIVSYEWDFGDNTTEIYVKGENLTDTATHAYAEAGTYTVRLTVTDNDGLTNTAKESVLVKATQPNIVLYIAAVVAIIIVIATVALYFLKVRKTRPT